MTREKMITAISEVVNSLNYTLYTGVEYRINETVKFLPAAWLIPAKLIKIEGRNRGTLVYALTIHLMHSGKQLTEELKLAAWSKMEQDAITMYKQLSAHKDITSISAMQCTPAEFSLSNHGEVSLTVNFDMAISFCS